MAVQLLDTAFNNYWNLLTPVQKESLLNVAKNYVQLKEVSADMRRELIRAERQAHLRGECKLYSWEEVKAMINDAK